MKKLYKLKNWYSLEDAAKRLTMTLGEEISVNDVLQMSVEGHLPLSWNMRHITAQQVVPYTGITTITILLSALIEKFKELGKDNLAEAVFSTFIEGKDDNGDPYFKLKNETPKPFFQKNIQDFTKQGEKPASEEEKTIFVKNYPRISL